MKNLRLKRETMIELTDTEMSAINAAIQELTAACVTLTVVCVSVANCPTGYCTTTAVCA